MVRDPGASTASRPATLASEPKFDTANILARSSLAGIPVFGDPRIMSQALGHMLLPKPIAI